VKNPSKHVPSSYGVGLQGKGRTAEQAADEHGRIFASMAYTLNVEHAAESFMAGYRYAIAMGAVGLARTGKRKRKGGK
jgi:hypothetical protein